MSFINRHRRTRLLVAAAAVCFFGCGGGDEPDGGSGSYESVSIGGRTWMAKNLNIEAGNSWCYDNSPENCAVYGRLYDWNTAKTACPSGWKLPDTADWNSLVDAAGGWEDAGKALKSTGGWNEYGNGTDNFGFAALPGGYRNSGNRFYAVGNNAVWWTVTAGRDGYAYVWDISYAFDDAQPDTRLVGLGLSVRCVKR